MAGLSESRWSENCPAGRLAVSDMFRREGPRSHTLPTRTFKELVESEADCGKK
jgi:hypothetical protein